MSDETLPQPRIESQEFLGVEQIASRNIGETDLNAAETASRTKTENERDLVRVASKVNKNGRGLHLRISKFLSRNRCGKNSEETSLGSSKTADTSSSLSNESRIDYKNPQVSSSKLPRIASHLKRLMKFKTTREIKTEEEIIIVPAREKNSTNTDAAVPVSDSQNIVSQEPSAFNVEITSENGISDTGRSENRLNNVNEESRDYENSRTEITAENPPAAVLVEEDVLTGELAGAQAEVEIQVSRRTTRDVTPRIIPPFLHIREEETRVRVNPLNVFGGERDSIVTGSESSSVSEVADANEQSEGRDAVEQYYNAVLRSEIRKKFRHLDDEPPIY